jgi:hypothetical protein
MRWTLVGHKVATLGHAKASDCAGLAVAAKGVVEAHACVERVRHAAVHAAAVQVAQAVRAVHKVQANARRQPQEVKGARVGKTGRDEREAVEREKEAAPVTHTDPRARVCVAQVPLTSSRPLWCPRTALIVD